VNGLYLIGPYAVWLPAVVTAGGFLFARRLGVITRPLPLVILFLVAALLQFVSGTYSPAGALGLVLQAGLAIYILIQIKLGA
jgi:hypothetical protein